jgi:putative hemolysin
LRFGGSEKRKKRIEDVGFKCTIYWVLRSGWEFRFILNEEVCMQTTLAAAFVANNDTNDLLICSSPDGSVWSANTQVTGQSSKDSPSMVFFNFQFWLVFIANNETNDVLICSSPDGKTWSKNTQVGQSSKNSPSIVVFNNGLWLAFVANNKTNDVLICSSPDGLHWSNNTQVTGQSSKAAPSLAVFNKKLWLAFVANNDTNDLLICSSPDGRSWSNNTQVKGQSSKGEPSLAVFDNKLWLAFIANNDTNDVLVCSSPDGVTWSNNAQVGQSSKTAPSLAVYDNKLILSFIANNNTDQVLVCSSSDGLHWSGNIQMGAGVQLQSSGYGPSLAPAVLITGQLYPRYQILTLIYTVPGTKGGNSKSDVNYTSTNSVGTVVSITNSFSDAGNASITVGDQNTNSSYQFGFTQTDTDSTSVAVTNTTTSGLEVFGPNTDGIDHGNDMFVLWTNPVLNVSIDPYGNKQWSFSVDGTMTTVYVYVSELQNPATMRADVKQALTAAGLTTTDFAQILATDPFASASAAIDPDRFMLCTHGFAYEPPLEATDPAPQTSYTQTNSVTDTNVHTVTVQYTVGATATDPIADDISLKVADQLQWTITNSYETISTATESASLVIAGPAFGYTGPIDLLVYWDTIYHTFLFAFPSATLPIVASGTVLDNLGQPVGNTAVTLTAGSLTLSTFTGLTGDYRFYNAPAGQAKITISGQQFPVPVGPTAPKQVLKLAASKPISVQKSEAAH